MHQASVLKAGFGTLEQAHLQTEGIHCRGKKTTEIPLNNNYEVQIFLLWFVVYMYNVVQVFYHSLTCYNLASLHVNVQSLFYF